MNPITINSESIAKMRLPMAIMVVLIHHEIVWRAAESSWNSVYDLIVNLIGGGICQMAVPTFFLISGWLFFYGLSKWNWDVWYGKIKRRFWSLLVPYILWNIIKVIVASILTTKSFNVVDIFHCIVNIGLKEIFWTPIDFPLWFVRDLMLCVIISPILWYGIKKAGKWFVAVLLVMYVFSVPPFHAHLSGVAVPLFVLGGFIQLFRNDGIIIKLDNKILIMMWAILLVAHVLTVGVVEYLSTILLRFMKLCGVLLAFALTKYIVNEKVVNTLKDMGQCSFWLFAAHTVLLRDLSFLLVWKTLPMDNAYIALLAYLITITLTLTLCFLTYYIGKMFMPKTVNILCGR